MKPSLKPPAPANKSRYVIPFQVEINSFFSDIIIFCHLSNSVIQLLPTRYNSLQEVLLFEAKFLMLVEIDLYTTLKQLWGLSLTVQITIYW